MSLSREDLVAYALHGLDAEEHARIEAALDDSSRAELTQIEEHLSKHDQVTEIQAPVSVWRGIEKRATWPCEVAEYITPPTTSGVARKCPA